MSQVSPATPAGSGQPSRTAEFGPADWHTGAALALVFFIFYAGFTHGRFTSTDETGVFAVTESLYERHTLEVPIHIHAHAGAGERIYSPFAVGQSVLALPLYALAKGARVVLPESWASALAGRRVEDHTALRPIDRARISRALSPGEPAVAHSVYGGTLETFFVGLYSPILSSLLAMSLFVLLRRLDVSPRAALLTTFLICACSYPATHSVYFLRHTGETTLLIFAFTLIRHYLSTGSTGALALGCTSASLIFLVRFPGILAGPAIGVYVIHALWSRHRSEPRSWIPDLLAVALPLVTCAGIHMGVNYEKWGTLLASPIVAAGFERSASFRTALFAFLLSPGIGVFSYSPLLLLFPWTFRAAWNRWRWESVAVCIFALTQLLFFSNYRYWTGLWSAPGPRYLFPSCVVLLVSLGAWLDRRQQWRTRAIVACLAVAGAAVQVSLLTAEWFAVIHRERYASYDPQFSFLFRLDASPILASGRAAADGFVDTWLWKLATGWPGHAPLPLIATILTALWIAVSITGAWLLWRHVEPVRPRANVAP